MSTADGGGLDELGCRGGATTATGEGVLQSSDAGELTREELLEAKWDSSRKVGELGGEGNVACCRYDGLDL